MVVKELLLPPDANGPVFCDFQREVSVMSKLQHPNIVRLMGVAFCPLRMVMEFCNAGDLFHAIGEGSIKQRLQICMDIARGMDFLHRQDPPLAHCDLRSPNVLLTRDKAGLHAKVADFGLTVSVAARLNLSLQTWQWMAPEAQMGDFYDETCDLYSFGIVVWEVYSGERPFKTYQDQGMKQCDRKVITEDLRPAIPDTTPPALAALITCLWHKEPAMRPRFSECLEVFKSPDRASQLRAKRNDSVLGSGLADCKRNTFRLPGAEKVTCAAAVGALTWVGGDKGSICVLDSSLKLLSTGQAQAGSVGLCPSTDGVVFVADADGLISTWQLPAPPPPTEPDQSAAPLAANVASLSSGAAASPLPASKASLDNQQRGSLDSQQRGWQSAARPPVSPRMASAKGLNSTLQLGRKQARGRTGAAMALTQMGVPETQPHRHDQVVALLVLRAGETLTLVASRAGTISIWKSTTDMSVLSVGAGLTALCAAPLQASCIAVAAAGKTLFRIKRDATVTLFKHGTERAIEALCAGGPNRLWSAEKGALCIWDVVSGTRLRSVSNFVTTIGITCVCPVHVSTRHALWTGADKELSVWDAATGQLLLSLAVQSRITALVTVSSDAVLVIFSDGGATSFELPPRL